MASTGPSFFISGDCRDQAYRNVRDNLLTINKVHYPNRPGPRQFIESLWSRYSDLADPHFREDARNHFLERFWEMYLAVTLRARGFNLNRGGSEGPEFCFVYNGHKVWVEAVVPGSGEGVDRVPEICYEKVQEVPTEKILLRFTNSLDEKRKRYKEALRKRIINPNDLYLLAINSRGIPHGPFGNTMPFFVQAFLPFGNLAMDIDTRTIKPVKIYYQCRENVVKASGEAVSTTAFLNHEFSFVSAVLHSAVDCVNHHDILGEDFIILHNPTALYPIDPSGFLWCEQMFYRDGRIERKAGHQT
jgi:hypothetical protein